MRLFCVKKIHGFLFPVSCTSEWRVWRCQNEHLQQWWRMEHCQVLTVLVDVVLSFECARQILGGILADLWFAVHKLSIRSCLVWFVLLWIVQRTFRGVGTRWDNLSNCESKLAGKLTVHHGVQNIGATSEIQICKVGL